MRIERFRIQGFKSISDVEIVGLSDINVFCGQNGSGRSNIFQSLAVWCWSLVLGERPVGQLSLLPPEHLMRWEDLEDRFGLPLFRLGGDNAIRLQVEVILDGSDWQSPCTSTEKAMAELLSLVDSQITEDTEIRILSRSELNLHPKGTLCLTKNWVSIGTLQLGLSPHTLGLLLNRFHIIPATRRFEREQQVEEEQLGRVNAGNLKRALLDADFGHDAERRRRLTMLRRILSGPPFHLGELDVVLDTDASRIDVGFVGTHGWLPLESMGSGVQQILLILGQILFNECPIVAIEEPEINLSPQYQEFLLAALRRLMADPHVELDQLLVSTHSPCFECEDVNFEVSLDDHAATKVTRVPAGMGERDRVYDQP